MSTSAITFAIIVAVVILFVWGRIPVVGVAVGTAIALYATGVLTAPEALAGFGDPVVIFIATLFIVAAGLEATGDTAWAGQQVIAHAGSERVRLLVLLSLVSGIVTAVITPNGAVAALLPVVMVICVRLNRPPSQLLLPFVFASHAGSMLALTGTPVNVLVSDASVTAGAGPFSFLEFAIVGIPLLIGTIAISIALGERLLPHCWGQAVPADLSLHARTLVEQYRLDRDASPPNVVFNRVSGLGEVVVPPRSNLIGTKVFPGMVTESGDLVIVAVQRRGENLESPDTVLASGDALLLKGTWEALDKHLEDPNVLVVDHPDLVRRQAVPLSKGAWIAIGVLAAMVLTLATGAMPSPMATLIAATAMVLSGVLSVERAYRSINWTTVILVGAMIPLSTAMTQSGAAGQLADLVVRVVGDAGPRALLAGFFVLTAVLGQLISNTATAIIILPVAAAAAADLGISPRPMLMTVAVAAAAALLTPVATPVNLIVMEPGGYRFTDYTKFGLPVLAWFFVVAVFYVPLFWSF